MTISAITDPRDTPSGVAPNAPNAANATIARLTALSMSSIDMSMLIAFRRARNPKVPIEKRSADRIR